MILELIRGFGEVLLALANSKDAYIMVSGHFIIAQALNNDCGFLFLNQARGFCNEMFRVLLELAEDSRLHAFENQILFIHKIEDNKLYNITIYQPKPDGPTRTIIAKKGEFAPVPGKNQIKLKLIDGTSDEPNLESPDNFYKLNFKNYFMTLDLSKDTETIEKKPKSMTFKELREEIEKMQRLFIDTAHLKTEYLRKITWSFSALIFVLLGFPLAVITNRREKSTNIVVAILCAVFYYLLSLGCEALSVKNILPTALIMWVPNIVAGIGAIFLNYKCVS